MISTLDIVKHSHRLVHSTSNFISIAYKVYYKNHILDRDISCDLDNIVTRIGSHVFSASEFKKLKMAFQYIVSNYYKLHLSSDPLASLACPTEGDVVVSQVGVFDYEPANIQHVPHRARANTYDG